MALPVHIAHLVYRFSTGGLENGVVNLINHLPPQHFTHTIICLNGFDPEFAKRLQQPVTIRSLDKRPGGDWRYFIKFWKLLRALKPDILHTRNLATLEYQFPAMLAGVPQRIHGEHGWDMADLSGENNHHLKIRRLFKHWVDDFIGLSGQTCDYLVSRVGVRQQHCYRIINGVDVEKFAPLQAPAKQPLLASSISCDSSDDSIIIGTVGRLAAVKNQSLLVDAFEKLCISQPDLAQRLQLVLIGEGEQRSLLESQIKQCQHAQQIHLLGDQQLVDQLIPQLDIFVLPSLAEGISNTLLEAMACGVPCIATDVGGNSELVIDNQTGQLVPSEQPEPLIESMLIYARDPELRRKHGANARTRAIEQFSLSQMVETYRQLYASRHPELQKVSNSLCAE